MPFTRTMVLVTATLLAVSSAENITGNMSFTPDFNLSWTLTDCSNPNEGMVEFTLSWASTYDWAAFGLHPEPGKGMPDAEIFMCNPSSQPVCQVRNSAGGYELPPVDKVQYITLVRSSKGSTTSSATFTRTIAAVQGSPLSVPLTYHGDNGLIYALGMWSGGVPQKHQGTAGRSSQNFYDPHHPAPGPAPAPPSKKAGVWPNLFDANMTIAMSQEAKGASTLKVGIHARLRYDFPARSQLWTYTDFKGNDAGSELWVGDMLYSITPGGSKCYVSNMTFSILRPDWLQGTNYVSTHWLLRQPAFPGSSPPPSLSDPASRSAAPASACKPVDYIRGDLYQIPNTLGMTNSWVVTDSPIAEPIRLEGPDNFDEPTYLSILEFADFEKVSSFDPSLFVPPASCGSLIAASGPAPGKNLRFQSPLAWSSAGIMQSFAQLH